MTSSQGSSFVFKERRERVCSASSPTPLRLPQPTTGHPVFDPKNHDIRAAPAAMMFEVFRCKCGKPARVRCFNGVGTY
jgi:hypothetical protein